MDSVSNSGTWILQKNNEEMTSYAHEGKLQNIKMLLSKYNF